MLRIPFKLFSVIAIALCLYGGMQTASALPASKQPETPHLKFVTEFVRELAEIQDIRDQFDREMSATDNPNILSISSYSFTRMTLELKSQAAILGRMRLNKPFDFLIPSITEIYAEKIIIYQRMLEIDRAVLAGPREGVDYSKMVSELPELRARLDDADHTLFQDSPTVFMVLIDPKADSNDHVSHLVITCAERSRLIDYINTSFGDKLNLKDQSYGVGIATVLRDALLNKGHKCSDEPWD